MHYLITGHTGFKGAWLSMILKAKGNKVSGISLAAEKSSIFNLSNLEDIFENNIIKDIRNISDMKLLDVVAGGGEFVYLASKKDLNNHSIYVIQYTFFNRLGMYSDMNEDRFISMCRTELNENDIDDKPIVEFYRQWLKYFYS